MTTMKATKRRTDTKTREREKEKKKKKKKKGRRTTTQRTKYITYIREERAHTIHSFTCSRVYFFFFCCLFVYSFVSKNAPCMLVCSYTPSVLSLFSSCFCAFGWCVVLISEHDHTHIAPARPTVYRSVVGRQVPLLVFSFY